MTNPLIEKFYELHPEKKEKPKPEEIKTTPTKDELEALAFYVNTTSNKITVNSNGSNYINATNASVSLKPKALQTYDVDVCKDTFCKLLKG